MCGSRHAVLNTSISAERLAPSLPTLKIALPPLPWSGLTTISPCSAGRRAPRRAARDQRRRHERHNRARTPFRARCAPLAGSLTTSVSCGDPLEQMRGGDVAEVERRILPHQDDIGLGAEIEADRDRRSEMIADDALHGHRMRLGPDAAVAIVEVLGLMEQPVPARLRRQHQREGRIAGDVDRIERVHLDGDGAGSCIRTPVCGCL
jgi:hypothetical protein